MKSRTGTSKSFAVFAIVMAAALVLGTIVVLGGEFIGREESRDDDDTVQQEVARLETAVALDPDDGNSAAILANIYANQGDVTRAIPLYERATVSRPDDGNLRLAFGIALLRNGSFLDARIQLERALDLLPESAGPSFYLGQLEQFKPDPDDEAAKEWYERAIEIAPDSFLADEARDRIAEIEGIEPTEAPVP